MGFIGMVRGVITVRSATQLRWIEGIRWYISMTETTDTCDKGRSEREKALARAEEIKVILSPSVDGFPRPKKSSDLELTKSNPLLETGESLKQQRQQTLVLDQGASREVRCTKIGNQSSWKKAKGQLVCSDEWKGRMIGDILKT
ncbi:hypothetical protein Cni_G23286 [Canna indica]|uniref:Uncharacterized protein n=1 Tax=Canna indica TaxID=4628 RepID=A0AAQ3QM92_9LILI|nr:hypothetical protein Cni_G23286 [Canna indica]